MYLDVSQALLKPETPFPFRHQEQLPPQESFGDTIVFEGPVVLEGQYEILGNALRLKGHLTAKAIAPCALCLTPATYHVDVPFDEIITHVDRLTSFMTEECDQVAFEGSKVDLYQMALTLTVLDLPIRFLCEGGCKTVSTDILAHACQKEMPNQHPFSALQQLLTKDQEV